MVCLSSPEDCGREILDCPRGGARVAVNQDVVRLDVAVNQVALFEILEHLNMLDFDEFGADFHGTLLLHQSVVFNKCRARGIVPMLKPPHGSRNQTIFSARN